MAQQNLYRSSYLYQCTAYIVSLFYKFSHFWLLQWWHNRNAHKNGFKMANIFYFILQDTGLIVLTPLCAIAFDEAQKHDSFTEKCSFIQNSLKRWILLLYLSINLSIVPSIKTGIVCELHSSADFIESALSARWIIQYEVNTSLSIDVFHFQWHFYLQSVQWLWLNVLITCDC